METSLVSFVGGGIREVSVWRKREQVMARVCKAILVQPYHTIPPSWYSHTISYYHPGTTIPYHTTILVQPYYTIPYYHPGTTIPYYTTILVQPYHTIPTSCYNHTIPYYHPSTTLPYHITVLFQPPGNNIIHY